MARIICLMVALAAASLAGGEELQFNGGADISYTLPRDARATLNIIDARGWIVREVIRGVDQKAGRQTVHWDGCDAMGRPVPPGDYAWKLIHHTGLKADYILSVANSGQPPYRTDDHKGSWGACHGNPVSVAADQSGLYLTWVCEEGNAVFAKTDYDGKAIFKIHASQAWGANWAAAVCGNNLYRVERGGKGPVLLKFDATTGRYVNWEAKGEGISGGNISLGVEQPRTDDPNKKVERHPQAVAANDAFIAVSFPDMNELAVFKASGEKVKDIAVEKPRGVAFLPDGRLALCQPKQVTAIDLATGKSEALISEKLDAAWGIALARDGASLWITDQGPSNQVKQFGLDGKLMKTFGRKGGMPDEGRIDHNSFLNPRGIACGTDGNIYVTEDSLLRRISRWSPDGKLLREWFGPLGPQKTCWPNMNNPSEVYYQNWGVIIRCDVDLKKKTWTPVAWYKIDVPNCRQPYVWEYKNNKYLYAETSKIFIYDKNADRWQVAVDFAFGEDNKWKIWCDLNLDGKQSDDELTPNGFRLGFGRVDPKTFVIHAESGGLIRIAPDSIAANGVPVYSATARKSLTKEPPRGTMNAWYDPFPIYGIHGCEPASDGGVFTAINGGRQGGRSFWDRASWSNLIKFDADGNQLWRAGVHAGGKMNYGDMRMIFRICGISRGLVFLTDVEVQINAYTEDGLFVDSLMDRNDMAGGRAALSPNSLTVEHFTGLVVDDSKSGKTYLYAGSTEDARIWEITGADSIKRMAGKVTLKTPGPLKAPAEYAIAPSKPPRKPEYNDGGADGFLTDPEWEAAKCLPLVDEGTLLAKFYARYDDQHLWLAAHVWDTSPAANAAQDVEQAFTLGDCIDFYFGADPASKEPAPGDLRILIAPMKPSRLYNGRIVIYRPKLADGAQKKPYEFASPVSSFTMDSVAEITGDKLATFYRWESGLGYTCEAKIPLSALPELGFADEAAPGRKIRFDCGVIYSNPGGNSRVKRVYWSQSSAETNAVTDLPTEAKLFPQLWGAAAIMPRE